MLGDGFVVQMCGRGRIDHEVDEEVLGWQDVGEES